MHPPVFQCRRQIRGILQTKRRDREHRSGSVDSARHIQELVSHRRQILPVRRAGVRDEVRLVDVQRRPGRPAVLRGQRDRRSERLREQRHVGHHKVSGQAGELDGSRRRTHQEEDDLHAADPPQDVVLHCKSDHPVRAHLIPQRLRVLSACRRRREDDDVYIDPTRPGRVPLARL